MIEPQSLTDDEVEQFLRGAPTCYLNNKHISGTDVLAYLKKLERRIVILAMAVADKVPHD